MAGARAIHSTAQCSLRMDKSLLSHSTIDWELTVFAVASCIPHPLFIYFSLSFSPTLLSKSGCGIQKAIFSVFFHSHSSQVICRISWSLWGEFVHGKQWHIRHRVSPHHAQRHFALLWRRSQVRDPPRLGLWRIPRLPADGLPTHAAWSSSVSSRRPSGRHGSVSLGNDAQPASVLHAVGRRIGLCQ